MSTKKKPARKTTQLAIDWGPCTAGWWCHGNGRATSVTFGSEPNYRLCDGCREQALEGTAPFAAACDGPKEQIQLYARVRATPKGVVPCVQDEYRRMKREQYEGPDAQRIEGALGEILRGVLSLQTPKPMSDLPAAARLVLKELVAAGGAFVPEPELPGGAPRTSAGALKKAGYPVRSATAARRAGWPVPEGATGYHYYGTT
jgi:hypothetical protein